MLAKRQQCYSCKRNVYSSEKVDANGRIFHQGCLKCEECGVALTPKGLKKLNGTYYCKEHHQKNLFAPRPQANDEDDKDDKKQAAMVGAAANGAKKKKVSIELPTSDDSSTQSSSSAKERSISFSDVVEASSGITVSGTFLTVSGLSGKKDKKAAKKQSKEAEKQKKKEEKEQAGYMRKRSSSFSGVTSGIINLVSSGGGVFKTRSRDAHSFEQDKIVEMAESSGSVEVDDNNDDSDEADEKKLALQKKIEEMKKRNEQWMKRIENEIGRKKSAKNEESESEASDSDIDTSDITFTTEQDATEISDGESDTELSETSDNESDDEAEVQRLLREREEELKRKREEIKRKEEEMQRKLEEMKRKEEEVLRKEEELKKKEEERMRRKKEKQQQRKKEKLAAALNKPDEDEELKQIEEEMRKQEEELRKVEEKIRLKEAKLKEKERRMLLEASGSAEVVGLVAGPAEDKADATADDDEAKKQKREMWMKEIDEEVERRRKDKKASQGGDAEEKVVAKTEPTKRTSGDPSRRKRELLALLNSDSDDGQEDGESTKEASPSSDDSQSEGAGQEMRDELVARCTYVWALDKQKKEEEEKKKREEDAKDAAQRERDGEQQRREALKKKEEERERKQKEEEWERMQQRVEEELRLEEAKKRVEEERRLREQTLKRRNEAWFRKMEEEMAAREETLRQLREAEEKQKAAENDQRRAMGLPPLVESSDSNTSSSSLKYDDSDKSVDIVVAAAALGASPKRVLSKPMIPRKPLPPTPLMERERKAGSDLAGELASRRAKGISWDSMAGDMVKVSVAAGPIVHERRSSVDSGSAAAKKASSGARRVSDVDAALDAADRKAAKASKRQSVEGVLGKASKKPLLLLRPAVALRNGPKDKKAKKQKKDMEKIMKKRKKLQKKGANALVNEERPQCLYGDGCKSLDPDHWVVFQHTPVEKREEEMKSKAEKEARRRAKGKERVSTDEDEDEAEREREREEERERRLAAQRRGEESSDSVRALEEEMLKNGDTQDEEAWKVMRKQLARERERKMELAEIEREKTALLTERKRIEFEMSSIRAERKQIEEESRSRIDVRSREKQQEREANNRGRVGKGVAAAQPKTRQAHVQERNNFYMQKLQNIKDKKPQQQQPATPQKKSAGVKSPQQKARASATKNGVARVNPADGARKPGSKKLPAVPRSSSSSSSASSSPAKSSPSSSPSSKSSPASSPLKSLPSGPRSRKEVMKLRESEMMANTKFMAKALQSYKSSDKKHLSFPRGASVRVLVVNEEEGMLYGCCNKKSRPLFVNLTVHRMSFTFTAALTASGKESPGALDSSQPSVIQSPPSYPGQHSSPFLAAAWPGPEHPPSLHSPPLHPPPPYNLEFDPIYHCTSTSPVSAPISNFCYAAGLPPAASFCLPPFEQSHCAIPERSNIMWNEQLGARDNNHIDDDAFVNAFFRRSQPSFPASSSSSSASFPAATTTSSWQQQLSPPPSATTSAATTMATSASFHSQASDWSPAYRLDQRASTQLRHGRDPRQRSVGDTTSHHPAPANTGRTPPSLMAATGGDSCQAAFNTGFQSCYPSSTTLPPPQAAAMLPPPLVRSNEAEARTSLPRLAPRRALAAIAPRPPVPVVPTTATSTSTTFLPHRGHNAGARLPGPLPPSPAPWQPTQKPRSKNAAEQLSGISTTTTTMSTVITFVTSSPPSSTTSAAGRRASAAQARSMDAMTTAPTGKKRATRQPRKTHARIYKWKLWTGDTHLQYFTQFSRLASAFEESIWAYTVMHPSVMHEDTLRMSLLTANEQQHNEEGESDPLLFNVNVLVALAARLIGDRNTQKEFYHRARTQLADLFDCQSVEVAEGLSAMSYYALGEADFNQFSYYNTLSLRMCQQLGAYHTDAFSRSFYVFLLDPSNSFHAKMALVKSLASLGPSGPRLPISALAAFYHSCPEISPPSSPLASTAAPPSSPPADDPYAQYLYTRVSHIQNEEQRRKMYSQLRKSTIMATYTTNCTFLLAAYKGRQQQESQLPPAPAAPGAAAHRRTGPGSDDLYGQLLENLDFYEADLAGLEECGMAARLTSTLAWAALKTEVHWEAGQRDLARQSAQRFVKEVESFRSDICSLSCTSSMRFANVCSILLQCGEAETLRYLLELVEPWARGFTLASQITTKFKNLLPPPTQRGNKRQSSK